MTDIEDLLIKYEKNVPLDWEEKNYLCAFLISLTPKDESFLKKYDSILKDYIFEMTYFNYHQFASIEIITDLELTNEIIESGFDVKNSMEKVCDVSILEEYLSKFDKLLSKNHANTYNKEIYQQYKIEREILNKKVHENLFEQKVKSLKLKFLYLYISAIDLYNHYKIKNNLDNILVELNGISIEFEESTFAHIINGHVFNNHTANTEYQPNKSLFEIQGNVLAVIDSLIEIFNSINKLNILPDFSSTTKMLNIYVRKKNNQIFAIHINQAKRTIKGTRLSETYQRVASYYPVELESKLNDLELNFEITRIDEETEIFLKKK